METRAPALTVTRLDDGVTELRLCRPELLNRFDADLHTDFTRSLNEIAQDTSTRAVVLASTGKVFSAGGDLELMREAQRDDATRQATIRDARALLDAFFNLPQPMVAGVQGAAVGLGATVVLGCDGVVAARSASLADTHVNVGLVAGDGGCLFWPATAGMVRARRHLLTGDPLDAETAFQLGMVTDLVDEPDEVNATAVRVATKMAGHAPLAVQGTKRALNRLAAQRAGEVVDLSLALEERTLASDDLLEGVTAFENGRRPQFQGK